MTKEFAKTSFGLENPGENTLHQVSPNHLFSRAWWLEAATKGGWDEVRIEADGKLRARLAFSRQRHYLFGEILGCPPLTPFLGPEFFGLRRSGPRQIGEQHELAQQLIELLPKYSRFSQNFQPAVTNWLPFFWKGFSQHTRYTYQLRNLGNLEAVWEGFSSATRKAIRKAEREVKVIEHASAAELYGLLWKTYENQAKRPGYGLDLLERLVTAAGERDQGIVLSARDAQGKSHAATFLVWDDQAAYYLVGGSDPTVRSSGAVSLLMWNAIQRVAGKVAVFDFEGSMQPGIERFVRGFGSDQVPYFRVTKQSKLCSLAVQAKYLFRRSA